jgi:hypothetical protein
MTSLILITQPPPLLPLASILPEISSKREDFLFFFIYLTPLVPLSFKGEGESVEEGVQPL